MGAGLVVCLYLVGSMTAFTPSYSSQKLTTSKQLKSLSLILMAKDPYPDCVHTHRERRYHVSETNSAKLVSRRSLVNTIAVGVACLAPLPSQAGEVGARITKAVTTSDLGISVRTSVVKGAQVMDQLDGKWEKFSDRFGLGSERSKQIDRPKPKVIPDPLPLDIAIARKILDQSDQVFCTTSAISSAELQAQILKVANLVKISFERSGVALPQESSDKSSLLRFQNAAQFNFVVYSHFKAYLDLLVERNVPFGNFRSQFEDNLGQQLVSLFVPTYTNPAAKTDNRESLKAALEGIDKFLSAWTSRGLVALTERTEVDDEKISDWVDGVADLDYNISLDGDITLNSQMLLQEQGYRLYPNFCRYVVAHLMRQVGTGQKVSAMDYYFDTDYNSDPDKFEVKEVLMSIQLENP